MASDRCVIEINLTDETRIAIKELKRLHGVARERGDEDGADIALGIAQQFLQTLEPVPGNVAGHTATGANKLTCFFKVGEAPLASVAALRARYA